MTTVRFTRMPVKLRRSSLPVRTLTLPGKLSIVVSELHVTRWRTAYRQIRHDGVGGLSAYVGRDKLHVYKYLEAHRSIYTLEESQFQLVMSPVVHTAPFQ